jgi:hypothetical protein
MKKLLQQIGFFLLLSTFSSAHANNDTDYMTLDDVKKCAKLSVNIDDYKERTDDLYASKDKYERRIVNADETMSDALMWQGFQEAAGDRNGYNRSVNRYNAALRERRKALKSYNVQVKSFESAQRKHNKTIDRYINACTVKRYLLKDLQQVCQNISSRTLFCRRLRL